MWRRALRWLRWLAIALGVALALFFVVVTWIAEGVGGRLHGRGAVTGPARSSDAVAARKGRRAMPDALAPRAAAAALPDASHDTQILFGDLHVHTTYSNDAFFFSLPLMQGEGAHPPADACDFARFCAGLDFWSINDHAESITPAQWAETRESIRECNAVADPASPDTVAFLGWEWTQSIPDPSPEAPTHYGHKNVVLRDTADDAVPARPIGSGRASLFRVGLPSAVWALLRAGVAARDLGDPRPYLDFNRWTREVRALAPCPEGVPVRELPADCLEGAETPQALFAKLDDWGHASLVIPHGTSWGIHAPARAGLEQQLSRTDHDPERQRLFEVYSGHGASEVYRELRDFVVDEQGERRCAPPEDGYLPCCWRAGELIRERCGDDTPVDVCDARVERARQLALERAAPYGVVEGTTPDDWLECGQPPGGFLDAYQYRPRMSAQYGLALRGADGTTFRYGLIASSDNHKARAGAGYKEIARKAFGDAYGFRRDWYDRLAPPGADAPPSPEPVETAGLLAALGVGFERGASFYYTAGLVAVHARGRDRGAIWDALVARHAYGTSGPRILLWFDLVNDPSGRLRPMGSEVELDAPPRFEVRAAGAFEQRPGCPEPVRAALGADRLRRLCLDECHHPSDLRHRIERIEVVRIRKQRAPGERVADLVEDPWRVFECPDTRDGCRVAFSDRDDPEGRETVYYVRALQAPTPAVNGDPMRCRRDERGRCIEARGCPAAGPGFDPQDDCLAPVRERAWSSPIFVRSGQRSR